MLLGLSAVHPGYAAVEYVTSVQQAPEPDFVLYHPWGVAADTFGNIYVADTNHHRIVKFNRQGLPLWAATTAGSVGPLYYPQGIAVGSDASQSTIIYVADTANSRVVAFDDNGAYLFHFGGLGSGDGQLNSPNGIAVAPPYDAGGSQDVCVADTRNARVSCFSPRGVWRRSFYCSQCPPDSRFHVPLGIAIRRLDNGGLQLYVTDEYAHRVHVLSGRGNWLRSFGSPGTAEGQLSYPDDIAVDTDGAAYVVESGTYRVSKFNHDGNFVFSFNTGGGIPFAQPHGIALDEEGRLIVANTGESKVHKFKFVAPRLVLYDKIFASRDYWIDTLGVWLELRYNGVEQTCNAGGTATITAVGQSWTINVAAGPRTVNAVTTDVKMHLTAAQLSKIKQVWQAGGNVKVLAQFQARCEDGTRLTVKRRFSK